MRLVRLSHHNVLVLFLNIIVTLFFILVILLVTDIAMGIIMLLVEIGCLTLVLGGLWVAASVDV